MKTAKEVKAIIKKEKISFIQCCFTDILGNLKSVSITPTEIETALEEGMGFDGSSVEGFVRIEESDLLAKPDPETFHLIPWKNNSSRTARMFCDILNPDQTPYKGDPRFILKQALERTKNKGYVFYVGPELEYFYFSDNKEPLILDKASYYDGKPIDSGEELREKTVKALQAMGIKVEYSHHEVAPSQHEIDLRYDDGLKMADKVMTYRLAIKEIARQNGVYASFMPKPIQSENGSGMHTHQSLFKNGKNAFFNRRDKYHLSDIGKSYIAGLLRHCREITAVCNQWVNSYKRLVPGYEAPVYISWARKNRSALIRLPMYKPEKEKACRIEFRSPDPACNPYLAFSLMLAAGLKGIKEKYKLAEPIEKDIYEMDSEKRRELNISALPGTLIEALDEMEKSQLAKETLGEHIFNQFIANKKLEWDNYRVHISGYEIKRYFPLL